MQKLQDIRTEYKRHQLNKNDIAGNPLAQLQLWLDEAIHAKVLEPTAMTLATSSSSGVPSSRIVLLKDLNEHGLTFFTNYNSHKAQDIFENPQVALLFFWPELERQVRINGSAEKVSSNESDAYFNSRPLMSRIGAISSPQSTKIPNRKFIEEKVEQTAEKYKDQEPNRPDYWGGYMVQPVAVEFWQGRESRLHDRILYEASNNQWHVSRLAP